jgi:hypothetical protein
MGKITSVERYVYHVSQPKNRLSILKNGLIGNVNHPFNVQGAVFAHNDMEPSIEWYPMNLDCILMPMKQYFQVLEAYDYWRIDTFSLGADWFHDEIMTEETWPSIRPTHKLYVYTATNIPLEYLTLCKVQEERVCLHQAVEGVVTASLKPAFRPYHINRYL